MRKLANYGVKLIKRYKLEESIYEDLRSLDTYGESILIAGIKKWGKTF